MIWFILGYTAVFFVVSVTAAAILVFILNSAIKYVLGRGLNL